MIEKFVQHIKDFYLFLWEMLKAIPFFFVGIKDIVFETAEQKDK